MNLLRTASASSSICGRRSGDDRRSDPDARVVVVATGGARGVTACCRKYPREFAAPRCCSAQRSDGSAGRHPRDGRRGVRALRAGVLSRELAAVPGHGRPTESPYRHYRRSGKRRRPSARSARCRALSKHPRRRHRSAEGTSRCGSGLQVGRVDMCCMARESRRRSARRRRSRTFAQSCPPSSVGSGI